MTFNFTTLTDMELQLMVGALPDTIERAEALAEMGARAAAQFLASRPRGWEDIAADLAAARTAEDWDRVADLHDERRALEVQIDEEALAARLAAVPPTAEQVQAYLTDYYDNLPLTYGIHIGAVVPSAEDADIAVDCNVTVYFSGKPDLHHWTLWMESGGVYGEW